MSQKIREILKELYYKGAKGSVLKDEDWINEAHQAIISVILEKMPEEKKFIIGKDVSNDNWQRVGFNSALAEMRERIKGI